MRPTIPEAMIAWWVLSLMLSHGLGLADGVCDGARETSVADKPLEVLVADVDVAGADEVDGADGVADGYGNPGIEGNIAVGRSERILKAWVISLPYILKSDSLDVCIQHGWQRPPAWQ
jgi:hypothetical protein